MFFSPCTSSLFIKEEMPGVEIVMLFVKKENECSPEEVYTLSNMKEVCQKLPHSFSHKCLKTLKEGDCSMGHIAPCKNQKDRVLTVETALG